MSPAFLFFMSFLLVVLIFAVDRDAAAGAAQSTTSVKTWLLQKLKIKSGDFTRKPRFVWSNPIAWREAKTKASAAKASLVRYGFILAGLIGAIALVVMFSHEQLQGDYISPSSFDPSTRTLAILGETKATTFTVGRTIAVTLNKQAAGRSKGSTPVVHGPLCRRSAKADHSARRRS